MQTRQLSYIGIRDPQTRQCKVMVKDNFSDSSWPLPMRLDLFKHSSTGFEWGYSGSGCAQTALAILTSHLIDQEHRTPVLMALGLRELPPKNERLGIEDHEFLAIAFHQRFKTRVVANLPDSGWELHEDEIDRLIMERVAHEVRA